MFREYLNFIQNIKNRPSPSSLASEQSFRILIKSRAAIDNFKQKLLKKFLFKPSYLVLRVWDFNLTRQILRPFHVMCQVLKIYNTAVLGRFEVLFISLLFILLHKSYGNYNMYVVIFLYINFHIFLDFKFPLI